MTNDDTKQQSVFDEDALAAMAARDWVRACELWARAREKRPSNLRAHSAGLEALVRAYRFEEAFTLADTLAERFAGRAEADLAIAALRTRQGRWAEAAEQYEAIASRSEKLADRVARLPTYRQAVFNAYGILAGSRRLPISLHQPEQSSFRNRKCGYVFVSGMPRAGTTALGHLLSIRQDVALFTELHNPYLTYAPNSFALDVVNAKRSRLPSVATEQILERATEASFIGDKRPLFHYSIPHTLEMMKDYRLTVLHVLRNPVLVAASYQRRAADPEDEWDPLRDLGNCIDEFNVMHQFLLDWADIAVAQGHQVIYVDYEQVFRDPDYAVGLFQAIGVTDPEASRGAIIRFQEASVSALTKERKIDPDIRAAVMKGLDHEVANRVSALTGIDVTVRQLDLATKSTA